MPPRETGLSKLAKKYGLTYACAKARIQHGIPLDVPKMANGNGKAWETRRANRSPEQIAASEARKVESNRKRVKNQRLKRERERARRRLQFPHERPAPVDAGGETCAITLKSAPRRQWQNPMALLAGKGGKNL